MHIVLARELLGRRRRWKDNIKFKVRQMGSEDGRWMEVAQDHIHPQAMLNLRVRLPESKCV
jgi:hypothetical protein